MPFPVYNTAAYIERLNAIIEASYPATPNFAKVKLYKNDVSPDANMTVATFEEADYDDYASINCVVGAPTLNDQGIVIAKSGLLNFATAAGIPTQTVYGIYITDMADTVVIAAQRFETPQILGGEFPQAVSGVWRVTEPLSSIGFINVEE